MKKYFFGCFTVHISRNLCSAANVLCGEINCLGSTSSMSSYLILPELGLALVINQILYYLESLRLFFKTLVSKSS